MDTLGHNHYRKFAEVTRFSYDIKKYWLKYTIIILDSKSSVFMGNSAKDTKHTRYIVRRINFVRNGENFKMRKIDWGEGGLQLSDIDTKNVG